MECLEQEIESHHGQVLEQTSIKLEPMYDVLLSTDGLNSGKTSLADQNSSSGIIVTSTLQSPFSHLSDNNVYSIMPSQSMKLDSLFYKNEEEMPCCAAVPLVLDVEPRPVELFMKLLEEPSKQDDNVVLILQESGKHVTFNLLFHFYTLDTLFSVCSGVFQTPF